MSNKFYIFFFKNTRKNACVPAILNGENSLKSGKTVSFATVI